MANEGEHQQETFKEAAPSYRFAPQTVDVDVDVSLIEDSLRLTPWQRLVENDRALGLVRMLEQARAHIDGTTDEDS